MLSDGAQGYGFPPTSELILRLIRLFESIPSCSPCILSQGGIAVVADVDVFLGYATGSVAILVREEDGFKVRAILDMR
ncbi:hypothetical protein LIP_0470 [Limnochorda pilosa]|uniref:Uncharacterized protein n=1 Tax=Limnochorda pilosa TaxID=1555112 RepID=A0A0K2SH19_LIMPI|nr:hypothetical protein LIP_0470 [Limnochorda pilosa]